MSSPSMFNFSGMRSPPRRPIIFPSATSPFCTSPSQLEEVTLDPDASLTYSMGLRSPNGGPMRGRSVKEFEDQHKTLKKENFNLKLRIYFLEERMGANFALDPENAVKKNIELKVEVESMRAELLEKQDLLCQAVKAMELEEEEHRKESQSKEREIQNLLELNENLNKKYETLQQEIRMQGDNLLLSSNRDLLSQDIIRDFDDKIHDLENQLMDERLTIEKLSTLNPELNDLQQALKTNEEKLGEKSRILLETNLKVKNLQGELEDKHKILKYTEADLRMKSTEINDIQNEVTNIKMLYKEAKSLYEQECKKNEKNKNAIANRNIKISELEETVEEFKSKLLKLENLPNEVKNESQSSLRSPKSRRSNNDSNSFSRSATSMVDNSAKTSYSRNVTIPGNKSQNSSGSRSPNQEVSKTELTPVKKLEKLEQDQRKACHIIQTMIEAKRQTSKKIEELHNSLQERDAQIQMMEEKLMTLESKENKSSQTKVELNLTTAAPASDDEQQCNQDIQEDQGVLLNQYRELIEKLDTQKQILYDTLKEKEVQMSTLHSKYKCVVEELKIKNNRLDEFDLVSRKGDSYNSKEKSDSGSEKVSIWIKESAEKDLEIEKLEKELAKRTNDLQTLVNNELWEKNREIEKLQSKFTQNLDKKNSEIAALKKNVFDQNNQLSRLKDKIVEIENKEIDTKTILNDSKILHDKIKYYTEDRKQLLDKIDNVKKESKNTSYERTTDLQDLQNELARSEDLRQKSNEVCAKLTTRLEELVQYLASLLQQKAILGFLGCDKNSRLQSFINQTLEMSRTLSLSINLNPDESLLQITNISNLLNESLNISELLPVAKDDSSQYTIIPENITLTYQSHLNIKTRDKNCEKEEVIKILRNQIRELKTEIELRDIELGNLQNQNIKHSKLSKYLDNTFNDKSKSDKSLSEKNILNISGIVNIQDSDSEAWSEPDLSVSKARIGLINDHSLKPSIKIQHSETSEIDVCQNRSINRTPSKRLSSSESKQTVTSLIHQINELEEKLRFKEQELEDGKIDMKEALKELQEEKIKLQEAITKHEELKQIIERLEKNTIEASEKLKAADEEIAKVNLYVTELEASKVLLTESMDTKSKAVQNKLNQLEVEKNEALQANIELEKKYHDVINEINSSEAKLYKLKDEMQQLQNNYEQEYVKKNEVERLVLIIQDLQEVLKNAECKMHEFEINEIELEQKHIQIEATYREKLNEMRMELDGATLQHTRLMLEKTKMYEEKFQMEIEIKELYEKEEEFKRQVKELKTDMCNLKDKLQKEVETLEVQKSCLHLKLSEVESTNAQLMNKMLKMQSGREINQTNSAPTSPVSNMLDTYYSRNRDLYNRQYSENSSGFGYEGQVVNYLNTKPDYNQGPIDLERLHANSSPDLGIESDHGRFSSLEANVVVPNNRFLQSLESGLGMDKENCQLVTCNNELCCNRLTENAHLRKKLRTTTKLLEDTASHLFKTNKRKKEVEKSICSQLQETNQLLKHVKANLHSGSDFAIKK